jgi:hypothetical protein
LYLLPPLLNIFFQVDNLVQEKNVLIKNKCTIQTCYCFFKVLPFKKFNCNIRFLTLHFENIIADPNLLASHILCLNETIIKNVHINSEIYDVLSQKFHVLPCYDEHGTMVLYDNVSLT